MSAYADFINRKASSLPESGKSIAPDSLHPMLHQWQAELVTWAAKVGRAAIWADTGLGKTVMQVSWAEAMRGNGIALIVAPLAVCHQTVKEAAKIEPHREPSRLAGAL